MLHFAVTDTNTRYSPTAMDNTQKTPQSKLLTDSIRELGAPRVILWVWVAFWECKRPPFGKCLNHTHTTPLAWRMIEKKDKKSAPHPPSTKRDNNRRVEVKWKPGGHAGVKYDLSKQMLFLRRDLFFPLGSLSSERLNCYRVAAPSSSSWMAVIVSSSSSTAQHHPRSADRRLGLAVAPRGNTLQWWCSVID